MDAVIVFFRDTMDGFLYYGIIAVNAIFIFAIIGYLGEKNHNKLMASIENNKIDNSNASYMPAPAPVAKPQAASMSIPQVQATQGIQAVAPAVTPVVQPVAPVASPAPVQPAQVTMTTPQVPSQSVATAPNPGVMPAAPTNVPEPAVDVANPEVEKAPQVLVID